MTIEEIIKKLPNPETFIGDVIRYPNVDEEPIEIAPEMSEANWHKAVISYHEFIIVKHWTGSGIVRKWQVKV